MEFRGGPNIYGVSIGVLCLENHYPKVPGHLKNATTFRFPVCYREVRGATVRRLIQEADPSLLGPFIEASLELQSEGVKAITGSCGFLALFQKEIVQAVNIPVFLSSLLQLSMIHPMLQKGKRVGVVTADSRALTPRHLEAVGAQNVPIWVAGMEGQKEFREVVLEEKKTNLNLVALEMEVLSVAKGLVASHSDIGAILLECTDLPPFSAKIQEAVGLPVFDIVTLIHWVHEAVMRSPFSGFMPPRV